MAELGQSVQYAAGLTAKKMEAYDEAKMRYAYFENGTITTGTGTIPLVKLPPGRVRVYPALSRWVSSAMVSLADVHIGYQAYTDEQGVAVVADDNAFLDNADGGAALDTAFLLPAKPTVYNSKSGILVEAMIDTANIESTDTFHGWVAYTQE